MATDLAQRAGDECAREAWAISEPEIVTIVDDEIDVRTRASDPLDGDYEYLRSELGRDPSDDETAAFERAYRDTWQRYLDEWLDGWEAGYVKAERARGRCWGFRYADGRHTTTGDGDRVHVAGALMSFPNESTRDRWLGQGPQREPISPEALPYGWHVWQAVAWEDAC